MIFALDYNGTDRMRGTGVGGAFAQLADKAKDTAVCPWKESRNGVCAGHMLKEPMKVQDVMLNLKAAGFEKAAMEEYLACWQRGAVKEQLELLSKQRGILLDRVHGAEKQIDCLDYLAYQIKKGSVTNELENGRKAKWRQTL